MGGKTPSTHAANQLAQLSSKSFFESDPSRRSFFKQLNEALQTGGVGARIPIIQRAVEGQNAVNAANLVNTQGLLARGGLGGTPYGVNQLAGQTAAGAQASADIPTRIAMEMIAGAPSAVTAGSGIPGLAAAASLQQQAQAQGAATAAGTGQAGGAILASLLGRSYGGSPGSGPATPDTVNVPQYATAGTSGYFSP